MNHIFLQRLLILEKVLYQKQLTIFLYQDIFHLKKIFFEVDTPEYPEIEINLLKLLKDTD